MGLKQIESLEEAKARGAMALVVFASVLGVLTFVCALYDSWQRGPVKAIVMASLMTGVVLVLVAIGFLIVLPKVKKSWEEAWATEEAKEPPNQRIDGDH